MTDLVTNQAAGRAVQWFQNVEDNSPVAAVIRLFIFTAGADNDYRDADTISALIATAANEVTNTGYTNRTQDDTDLVITIDDTNDRVDVDMSDETWTAVAAGDAWQRFVLGYDDDGTDTDTNTIPISSHDITVTPDGSDITVQIAAAGIFRAASST